MKNCAFLFSVVLCSVLSWGQMNTQVSPPKVTMCELYEHPEQYAGKIVEVRANVSGKYLALDDFSNQKSCSAYMRIHLELPQETTPATSFELVRGDAYNELLEKLHRGMNVIATFEGRFDPLFVWRDQKRVRVGAGTGKGYGRSLRYDGRIVIRKVSDLLARAVPSR